MNKKIAVIFILTISALIFLYLYSFGSLSGKRIALQSNPNSLKPGPVQIIAADNGSKQIFKTYKNQDLKENFYIINFPANWPVKAGDHPGSYKVVLGSGTLMTSLMDVADNTTLELFVLSQEEPRLQATFKDYKRLDYHQLTIDGQPAYQLTFTSLINGITYQTTRTYITGGDHAGVVEISANQKDFSNYQALSNLILDSFHWNNK